MPGVTFIWMLRWPERNLARKRREAAFRRTLVRESPQAGLYRYSAGCANGQRMSLPLFLREMEDANFHLLNSFGERPVRLAAIGVTMHDQLAPCRVLDLNVEAVEGSPDAEQKFQLGLYPDDLDFQDDRLMIERDDPEDAFKLSMLLSHNDWGKYFDCALPPFTDTAKIVEAVAELCRRNEVEWHFLNWAQYEEEWIPRQFRDRARTK